jgi:glutathione S-transferase
MKLLAALISPYTRKVRVVLAEKKIECEMQIVDVVPAENPVNAHNPLGKIPTLVLDDGTALYDSRVIVEFLDSVSPISRLIPETTRDRVAVRRWEALADGVLDAGLLVRYESVRDKKEQSQAWTDKQLARMKRGMEQMAKEIGAIYCHAERYSLADIAVACCMGWLDFRKPGGVDWRAEYVPVARH